MIPMRTIPGSIGTPPPLSRMLSGMANVSEYRADTLPSNVGSFLGITSVFRTRADMRLDWQGGLTATQVVESCSFVNGAVWVPIYTNYPPASTNFLLDPGSNPMMFYRIRVPQVAA